MSKNTIITLFGFILVGIIGYQAYLLDSKSENPIFKTKKDEPKITIEIEKKPIEKQVRELNQPKIQNNLDTEEMFDEKLIKEDLEKLFQDIFGNPKLQEGIKKGIKEIEQQLQTSFKEMEKELGKFSQEFENLSQNDQIFKDLLGNLGGLSLGGLTNIGKLNFTDRGKDYYLQLDIPGGANSEIDIKTKDNYLILTITQRMIKETPSSHSESSSAQQNIILIPVDALTDQLKTDYNEGILKITIPKVGTVRS